MKVKNRVKKQDDFQNLIRRGKELRSPEFKIYYSDNNLGYIRIGVSIPTKTGKAIIRNKVKRQIKAMLSSFIDLSKSLDIVVIPRKAFAIDNFENNRLSLKKLIEAIGE